MDQPNTPPNQPPDRQLPPPAAIPQPEAGIYYPRNQEIVGPEGLGGWLILVGFGLIVGPIYMLVTMAPLFAETFNPEAWQNLTDPSSDFYHPSWASLAITELTVNILLWLFRLYLLYLFFAKKRLFPKLFIVFAIITPIFVYLDAQWATKILNEVMFKFGEAPGPVMDADTQRELGRCMAALFIWCPYMMISRRVKNTFVNPRPESLSKIF